jgi:1-acyl-sn-glycerol-3-phosphate acyltransferase
MIMTPALACYFRKSSFLYSERIPAKGPVVVISNHAASFLDAVVMGVMLKRSIHFYARGDIFKKPWVRRVLGSLHMIPIYSADLARGDLHRNAGSFDAGSEVLKKGGLLLIFPEGLSRLERNFMPLKKGVSRIILQALDRHPHINVTVVPIGIHYTRHAFRADLQMITGEVVDVSGYRDEYHANAPKAVNHLTDELERLLKPVVLFVNQTERSGLLEQQLHMLAHETRGQFNQQIFDMQKALCDVVSDMSEQDSLTVKQQQDQYFATLSLQELHDKSFTGGTRYAGPLYWLVLWFPLFVVGALLNILPYMFGRYMADKKVTRADFYTSVLTAVSAFSYVIWLLLGLVFSFILKSNALLILFAVSPFLAWIALRWADAFRDWKFQTRYDTLRASDPELIKGLVQLRNEIRSVQKVRQVQDRL